MPDREWPPSDELLALLAGARWFAGKDRVPEGAEVVGAPVEDGLVTLAIVEVRFGGGIGRVAHAAIIADAGMGVQKQKAHFGPGAILYYLLL